MDRRRTSRETSPDRARVAYLPRPRSAAPALCRKVQIVYYLSRSGQLEHPHFMELPHLPNQHLRLKDVMERLTALRGRGMPSQYSWSCKRSYKNGYVWNDLSVNDVIYPAFGDEYVLKGSEIIQDSSDRFQQLERRPRSMPVMQPPRLQLRAEEEEEEEEERKSGKLTGGADNSCYGTPYSRCSRGVSTDEIEMVAKNRTEIPLDDDSPPSSSSSDRRPVRSDGGESEGEPGLGRGSVLLQLISCGSAASARGRAVGSSGRKSGSLHKGVLNRAANRAGEEVGLNRPVEDKEYYSGSIVLDTDRAPQGADPALKKSNSYNEERGSKLEERLETREEIGSVKAKCIPGRKRASCKAAAAQHVTMGNK